MAQVTLKGNPVNTSGNLPENGSAAPDFTVVQNDLSEASLKNFEGKTLILNIFPSIDTSTCATSVRKFNEQAAAYDDAVVLCVSGDLPFAQSRFCGAEGIDKVFTASVFRDAGQFGQAYGVNIIDGPLKGLLARSVVVIDKNGSVKYSELVGEIVDEPNYEAALAAI